MALKPIPAGSRFGKLTVLGLCRDYVRRAEYLCECDCGNETRVLGISLRNGNTKSCGCWKRSVRGILSTTHGHSRGGRRTPEFEAWLSMIHRCDAKPGQPDYRVYAGRGIMVTDEWIGPGGFKRFLAHVGPRPTAKHSLDRIDTNDHYAPGNVRWATIRQQTRNKRSNWFVLVAGEWLNAKDAAKVMNVAYSSLVNACRGAQGFPKGWPPITFKRTD